MTTAQRNATQHNRSTQHTADCNATQCNTTGRHNTQLIATQHNTTQHNATQPAQHDKTPDRYEIDGRAGRSTKNSTEKFGQKTLQVYADSFPIFSRFFSFPFSLPFFSLYLLPCIPFLSTGKVLASALEKTWKCNIDQL